MMKMKFNVIILILSSFIFSVTSVCVIEDDGSTNSTNSCVISLYKLEASFKLNSVNIESVDDRFYTPNSVISL